MKFGLGIWLLALCASGAVATRTHAYTPDRPSEEAERDCEAMTHNFVAHVLVPFWMLPGLGDYVCHRISHIERTSGTHESLTHILMISSTGVGVMTGLFLEINTSALLVMTASAVFHEAIVIWDIAYAEKRRPLSSIEQHMHSFLEVLPFTALAGMCCLNPRAARGLFGREARAKGFQLQWKRRSESPAYLASVLLLGTLALAIPYTEEFLRCFNVDHTIFPRPEVSGSG